MKNIAQSWRTSPNQQYGSIWYCYKTGGIPSFLRLVALTSEHFFNTHESSQLQSQFFDEHIKADIYYF